MNYITTDTVGQILVITINRPNVLNALNPQAHRELESAFDFYAKEKHLRVAILTGSGNRSFCTGSDIKEKSQKSYNPDFSPPSGVGGLTKRFDLNKPVIAAVNGYAYGGGMELMLSCDLIVAAEHAIFSLPEIRIGQAAFAGGIQHLVRSLPYARAMKILLTGEKITAQEMLSLNLINDVVPQEQLISTAMNYAEEIIKGAPLSVEATKAIARYAMNQSLEDSMSTFPHELVRMLVSNDTTEGGRAFTEKRLPNWTGT